MGKRDRPKPRQCRSRATQTSTTTHRWYTGSPPTHHRQRADLPNVPLWLTSRRRTSLVGPRRGLAAEGASQHPSQRLFRRTRPPRPPRVGGSVVHLLYQPDGLGGRASGELGRQALHQRLAVRPVRGIGGGGGRIEKARAKGQGGGRTSGDQQHIPWGGNPACQCTERGGCRRAPKGWAARWGHLRPRGSRSRPHCRKRHPTGGAGGRRSGAPTPAAVENVRLLVCHWEVCQ